jgi:hypothetical protein
MSLATLGARAGGARRHAGTRVERLGGEPTELVGRSRGPRQAHRTGSIWMLTSRSPRMIGPNQPKVRQAS